MCDELPCSPRTAASLYRRVAALSRGELSPPPIDGHAWAWPRQWHGHADGHGTRGHATHGQARGNRNSHAMAWSRRWRTAVAARAADAHLIDCGLSNKHIAASSGSRRPQLRITCITSGEKLDVHRRVKLQHGSAPSRVRILSASAPVGIRRSKRGECQKNPAGDARVGSHVASWTDKGQYVTSHSLLRPSGKEAPWRALAFRNARKIRTPGRPCGSGKCGTATVRISSNRDARAAPSAPEPSSCNRG